MPKIVENHCIRESWTYRISHVGMPRLQRKYPFTVDVNKIPVLRTFPFAQPIGKA
ncbi:hypothetical protein [Methanomethylophilus alvi]|uniref:hypothetical protein n=1 Tax=Methanomethylophilus alvi TaxID=1291540 RepID=UPI0037DC2848